MDRRKALALAGTIAITLTAAGTATAANLGLLASGGEAPVGQLDARNVAALTDTVPSTQPVTTVTQVQVVEDVITIPVDDGGAAAPGTHDQGDDRGTGAGRTGGADDDHGGLVPDHDDDRPAPAPAPAPAPTTAPTTSTTVFDDHGGERADDDDHADEPDDHGDDGEEHELDD